MADRETLLKILDLARWAPSGDNTQPWRFEIVSPEHIAVHGHDTRDWCLYDFDGHASHMAHGALLETLRIAATGFGLEASWTLREGTSDAAPIYDVSLQPRAGLVADPLMSAIETRCVQRRPMQTTPLTEVQRKRIADSVGAAHRVQFFESFQERLRVARLLWDNARIRLTCPEAYPVHKEIIEWHARFSTDRIPEQAVGVDPATARLMQWVMQSWDRVDFFNRYLMGTIPPRIQLDFLPALRCAAHVLVRPLAPCSTVADYVAAGVAMQRLWLTVAAEGLYLQPEMTPVIFRWYARAGRSFSRVEQIGEAASTLARDLEACAGMQQDDGAVFFCRVGYSAAPASRSLRKDVAELLVS